MSAKRKPGRPPEGRVKVTWYVLPHTAAKVRASATGETNTPGKVIDAKFRTMRQPGSSA